MVSWDHKLSVRKQCELLQLSRSRLYYQPVGESVENLRFMELKWSQKTGQSSKVYPEPLKGYGSGEAPEVYRSV